MNFTSQELDQIHAGLYLLSQQPNWSGHKESIDSTMDRIDEHLDAECKKIDEETDARLLAVQLEETF
jgi:hypothetical protein